MKRLQRQFTVLMAAVLLIGNLQAMSPPMEQLVQERAMARKWEEAEAERMADPSLRIKNIYQRLDLPRGWDEEKLTAPTIIPLMELFDDDDKIVEIIQNWRNEGHLFPDERFHPGSVSNAIVKYGANLFGMPLSAIERYLFQNEPTHQIRGKEGSVFYQKKIPEAAVYAMTPEERGGLLVLAATSPANDVDIIQKLIYWGADIQDSPFGAPALMRAATDNNTAAVKALLAAGANPNLQDGNGNTALLEAAANNNTEAIRALLNAPDIDVDIRDWHGMTALLFAVDRDNANAVKALLVAGADPNIHDNDLDTALDIAEAEGGNDEIINLLRQHGADYGIKRPSRFN